ncbi:MAG: hypothetical protein JJE46_00020, partial [Acidimicrobiia bacterium]|nr:hypothetical protein [Acidimicrobiia bacterium]
AQVQTTESGTTALRTRHTVAIFLVSLAGLLLEVGYTRVVSYKLWYYYTYLVLGLALLGIGSGGIFVVVWPRLRQAATDTVIAVCSVISAVAITAGYFLIARLHIDTVQIWDYGTSGSYKSLAKLGLICFVLFASFVPLGIIISTILGRGGNRVGRLYFSDLIGAGLGCALAIPLITWLGPPQVIVVSAVVFALVALVVMRRPSIPMAAVAAVAIVLAILASGAGLVDVRPEDRKADPEHAAFSDWGPVFRVDVAEIKPELKSLFHDGSFGSAIYAFDGNAAGVTRFNDDPRSLPFALLGTKPDHTLIIGSAGGNEIVAALHYGSKQIDGVELNPVTVDLVTERYRKFAGDLPDQPGVTIHQGDGRTYLARSNDNYDIIWFVAPDSYAANNAASSGAFVLSESYLYTTNMIKEAMSHLSDRGIMVVQFGELSFADAPNRTARYVMTARKALEEIGVENPGEHVIVAPYITNETGDLSTVMVKRTAFTPAEVQRFQAGITKVPKNEISWAPGLPPGPGLVPQLIEGSDQQAAKAAASYPREIHAISDDGPFFWHFASFTDVVKHFFTPISATDPEDSIGERVLVLLLAISVLYAAVFLLVPFLFVRKEWKALPRKGISAVYFATLGLGFMLFEISMIQRLVLFLGYPTYSLTVTLASILVFTGLGALLSNRLADRARTVLPIVFAVLCGLVAFYQWVLGGIIDSLLSEDLVVRVLVSLLVLAPLGLCLGMFMPLGLRVVGGLSDHADEYVAWAWAINGFFSVIGSVLTTMLAMSIGFRAVQLLALAVYAIAVLAFFRLVGRGRTTASSPIGA